MQLQLHQLLQLIHSLQHFNLLLNFVSVLMSHEFLKLFMPLFLLHPKNIHILKLMLLIELNQILHTLLTGLIS